MAVSAKGLTGKELSAFREVCKLYEDKQHKRAVKTADAILKKVPDHSETLAMKALTLSQMPGHKQEAYETARQAIRADMKGHLAWHVLGTIFKAELNYLEAYKAFKTALRLQPDNTVVQRDLAAVQVQLRDYTGHCETRRLLLVGRSGMATNWTGFGVANQLAGNGELALSVMEQYEATVDKVPENAYERSETALYKVRILEQMGDLAGALAMLQAPGFRAGVTDGLAWSEKRAELKLKLGDKAGAAAAYAELIKVNPENYGYHRGLQAAVLGLPAADVLVPGAKACEIPSSTMGPGGAATGLADPAAVDLLLGLYTALAAAFPRARAVKRIPLDFLPAAHPAFAPMLAAYLRAGVRKGLPSLYSDVKGLCRLPAEKGQGWEARQAARAAMGAAGHAAASPKTAVLAGIAAGFQAAATAGVSFTAASVEAYKAVVESTLLPAARAALEAAGLLQPAAPATATPEGGEGGDAAAVTTTFGWSFTPATFLAAVTADGDAKEGGENPAVVPWAALLAARVEDEAGCTAKALALLEGGIAHTPTAIDLYSAKARVLKHRGAFQAAADVADYARTLDFADRYLNVKAAQYALRAGRIEAANKTVGLFVKTDGIGAVEGDPLAALVGLQVMWYALETAAAYERSGNLGLALKYYTRVEAAVNEFAEDVSDFHVYVLRKGPLRSYADSLALMDQIKSHAYFLKAAAGAVRCLLGLQASADARKGTARCAEADAAALPAAEAGEPADAAAGLAARRAVAAVRSKAAAEAAAGVATAVATARNAKFAQQRSGAAGDDSAKDPALESLHDEDPVGDRQAAGTAPPPPKLSACVSNAVPVPAGSTLHLELAHKWARALTDALPPDVRVPRAAKTPSLIVPGVPVERTPLEGCPIARPALSSTGRTRNWVVSRGTAAEAHALAAEVELARGKTAQALAHLVKAAEVAGGLAGPDAPAQLHLTAARVFAAVAAAVADAATPAPLAAAFAKSVAGLTGGASPADAAGPFMQKLTAGAAKASGAAALTAALVAAEASGFPALPPTVAGGLARLPLDAAAAGKPGSGGPLVAAAQALASAATVTAADVELALGLLAAAVDTGAADAGAWAAARASLAAVAPDADAVAPLPAVLGTIATAAVSGVKGSGELTTNHPGGGVPVQEGTMMAKP